MHTYNIKGYNRYNGYEGTIQAKNPSTALKEFLTKKNIAYFKIQKMTTKVNGELLDLGYTNDEICDMIDFIVSKEDDYAPSASGSYRLL